MESESDVSKPKGHTRVQWAVVLAVNTTLFTYGLQCGWVSPVAKVLQSETESPVGRALSNTELSLIAGAPPISAMFAVPTLVYLVDNYGRRWSILFIAVSQLLCWIITICPSNFTTLFIARLFSGFGAGGCYHVVPMYIKEISQDNIRGTLGAICTVFQNLGILAVYCLGGYLGYYKMLYSVVGIPVLTILTFFKAPESPSYLVKIGKTEEAAKTVGYLRGLEPNDKRVQAEIDSLKREDDHFKSIPNISFCKIFKVKEWRRGFSVLFWLCVIRALNGCFAIIQYASILLEDSDVNISPVLQSLGIPIFMTIGAFVTMAVIDKMGRKMLLAINFAVTAVTFLGLASTIVLRDNGVATPGWLPVVALLVSVYCYGGGVSPVPFIVMSEIFNFQIRAKLMACLSILSWLLGFIQIMFFSAISNSLGVHATFYICGVLNVIGTIITVVFLPETSNKTVEQIECELNKKKKITQKTTTTE